jgi:hypothetical protein
MTTYRIDTAHLEQSAHWLLTHRCEVERLVHQVRCTLDTIVSEACRIPGADHAVREFAMEVERGGASAMHAVEAIATQLSRFAAHCDGMGGSGWHAMSGAGHLGGSPHHLSMHGHHHAASHHADSHPAAVHAATPVAAGVAPVTHGPATIPAQGSPAMPTHGVPAPPTTGNPAPIAVGAPHPIPAEPAGPAPHTPAPATGNAGATMDTTAAAAQSGGGMMAPHAAPQPIPAVPGGAAHQAAPIPGR